MKLKAELIFPGRLKDKPIICNLCKKFEITVSILEASFSTDTGWAIIILEGSKQELKKANDYLIKEEVEIEETEELT